MVADLSPADVNGGGLLDNAGRTLEGGIDYVGSAIDTGVSNVEDAFAFSGGRRRRRNRKSKKARKSKKSRKHKGGCGGSCAAAPVGGGRKKRRSCRK